MEEIKLKPCPFCGGKAKIVKTYTIWVKCINCHASANCHSTKKEAAAAWNRRMEEPDA